MSRWQPLIVLLALALVPTAARADYEWRPFSDGDATQIMLWRDGGQVGVYRFADDAYFPLDPATRRFGDRCAPPVEPPGRTNFGLVRERLRDGEHYRHDGHEVSREQVRQLLGDGRIPDNRGKWRVVVIGDGRDLVVQDFAAHAALAPWRDRVVVQGYAADHWHVARSGFATTGKPTVYVLQPDGTVLHRQDDYQGGAEALADALRKADPDYHPDRDPDRRKPELPFSVPLAVKLPWSVYALAGAALLVLFLRKRGQP